MHVTVAPIILSVLAGMALRQRVAAQDCGRASRQNANAGNTPVRQGR
jgi:hypothetical protein